MTSYKTLFCFNALWIPYLDVQYVNHRMQGPTICAVALQRAYLAAKVKAAKSSVDICSLEPVMQAKGRHVLMNTTAEGHAISSYVWGASSFPVSHTFHGGKKREREPVWHACSCNPSKTELWAYNLHGVCVCVCVCVCVFEAYKMHALLILLLWSASSPTQTSGTGFSILQVLHVGQ